MALSSRERSQIKSAIESLCSDISELEKEVPDWDNESKYGTKKYKAISGRITASAKRLAEFVNQFTY